jgi:predicted Zn-dependent protease
MPTVRASWQRFFGSILAALGRSIRSHPIRWAVILPLLALAGLAAGLWAWDDYHFRRTQSCLAQGRSREARHHLETCLKLRPRRVSVQLLAARVERQGGAFPEAEQHLVEARRLLPADSEELTREWALHRAALGELGLVEAFLRPKIRSDAGEGPLVCEALAEGYLRNYRGPEALAILDVWLEQQPDNLHALSLRGDVWRQAEALGKAAECYQRVLKLDPENDAARRWLALCLLDGGRPAEALPHWERLFRDHAEDADVQAYLAGCRYQLGQTDEARELIEKVLQSHPDHLAALRTAGELFLQQGQLEAAEAHVRRALRSAPRDYKLNGLLGQILHQQGNTAEAEAQRERTHQLELTWKRFRQLAREVAEHPQAPEYACELAGCLLDLGQRDLAQRWLLNVLRDDPHCRRAHELLARCYDEQGDADRAAYHRGQAASAAR